MYANYRTVGRLLSDGSPRFLVRRRRTGARGPYSPHLISCSNPREESLSSVGRGPYADYARRDMGIVRLHPDGRFDRSFSGDGHARFDFRNSDTAMAVALTTKGKLLVVGDGGRGHRGTRALVLRLRENSALDRTFSTDGVAKPFDGVLTFVTPTDGGKILIGGTRVGGGYVVARFGVGGRLDRTFGKDGSVTAPGGSQPPSPSMRGPCSPTGKIILCGAWLNNAQGYRAAVVRFLPRGRLDTSFGGGSKSLIDDQRFYWAQDCVSQDDGRIALAGEGSFVAARLEPEGLLDESFEDGGIVSTPLPGDPYSSESVAVQADGRIVVPGSAIVRYLGA